MANPLAITLVALAPPKTAGGSGDWVDIGVLRKALRLAIDVEALTGGGVLTVTIETTASTVGGARKICDETVIAQPTSGLDLMFGPCDRYVRATWTLTGATPSATFAVLGEAHVLFAEPKDLVGTQLPATVLDEIPMGAQLEGLLAATDEAHDYICSAFTPPITAWGNSLRMHTAALGRYAVMNGKGFDPENPTDELIRLGRTDAIQWLDRVSQGKLKPPDIVDSTPDVHEGGAFVVSGESRGW